MFGLLELNFCSSQFYFFFFFFQIKRNIIRQSWRGLIDPALFLSVKGDTTLEKAPFQDTICSLSVQAYSTESVVKSEAFIF